MFLTGLPEDRRTKDKALYLDDGLGLTLLRNEGYWVNNQDSIYAEKYKKCYNMRDNTY